MEVEPLLQQFLADLQQRARGARVVGVDLVDVEDRRLALGVARLGGVAGAQQPARGIGELDLAGAQHALVAERGLDLEEGALRHLDVVGERLLLGRLRDANLRLALGFSHPVIVPAPEGITFEVPAQTRVIVRGIDKEVVGQVAANIRSIRKPEPYKGKGVRYLNERILRKAGKTGKK